MPISTEGSGHETRDWLSGLYVYQLFLSQLYWVVVLLQRECNSEIIYFPPNPNSNFFVLDEMADPGQN